MMQRKRKQLAFIISGPSGAGKTTLIRYLSETVENLSVVLPATSRPIRADETDGVDALFVSVEEFERMIKDGEMLEWSKVYGTHYYGTPWASIRSIHPENDILIELDITGRDQFVQHFPDAITIFIMPPSVDESLRRFKERRDVPTSEIQNRIDTAQRQIAHADEYKYVIVNYDMEQTKKRLVGIIESERVRQWKCLSGNSDPSSSANAE